LHYMNDLDIDHEVKGRGIPLEKLYYIYYINYIHRSSASQNPWNSASSKLYYIREDLLRVVKFVSLKCAYIIIECYVIHHSSQIRGVINEVRKFPSLSRGVV